MSESQAILGELPPIRGSVCVAGSVAFVPQVPWVLSGTLRDNITFGLPFDADKYARVSSVQVKQWCLVSCGAQDLVNVHHYAGD